MSESTDQPVDRDTLYDEVWTNPVSVVAPRYGLSDVGLAKICRSLAIPLPSRGYWAKIKAGRVMNRAPLPKLKDPHPISTGLRKLPPEQVAARESARKEAARIRKEVQPEVPVPEESAPQHPLVKAASKRLRQRDDWPKDTTLRSSPKEVLHLAVTRATLDRALLIADGLLKALTPHGVSATIDAQRSVTFLEVQTPRASMEFSLTECAFRRT